MSPNDSLPTASDQQLAAGHLSQTSGWRVHAAGWGLGVGGVLAACSIAFAHAGHITQGREP
eukprot:7170574-Alexandrium_andersonii.AAC.1